MSNLRSGGALQVASSFLDELSVLREDREVLGRHPWLADRVDVVASPQVLANVTNPHSLRAVRTGRRRSPLAPGSWRRERDLHALQFLLFGPAYGAARARRTVVGFADGLSLFGMPEGALHIGTGDRLRHVVRSRVSRASFRRADHVVSEAPHTSAALHSLWGLSPDRISTVPNTLHTVFADRPRWEEVTIPAGDVPLALYPTRPYAHKNLALLGAVGDLLAHGPARVRFALTLSDMEWDSLDPDVRRHSVNLGPLRTAQLPTAYAAADLVVFPSLLESFSATPLEAIASGVPLVAADRPYVRDVAGEAAWYAEPTDPGAFAETITAALGDRAVRDRRVRFGLERASAWPSARDRAEHYLQVVDHVLALPQKRP